MDTLNTSKERSQKLEEFIDFLEQEEAAEDVPENVK